LGFANDFRQINFQRSRNPQQGVEGWISHLSLITTTPNPMVAAVHNRMPVIPSPEHYQWWLEPKRFEPEFLKTLLRPYPAEDMECNRVSKLVNNAKNDSPECLTPS
jgi:putative SOS response-associated peptidase YedK